MRAVHPARSRTSRLLLLLGSVALLGAGIWLVGAARPLPDHAGPALPAAEADPVPPTHPIAIVAPAPDLPQATAGGSATPPVAPPYTYVPAREMPDPARPPQWTETVTQPGPAVRPDPDTPPSMDIDPSRGRLPSARR